MALSSGSAYHDTSLDHCLAGRRTGADGTLYETSRFVVAFPRRGDNASNPQVTFGDPELGMARAMPSEENPVLDPEGKYR